MGVAAAAKRKGAASPSSDATGGAQQEPEN
jgi:hypothetical protein